MKFRKLTERMTYDDYIVDYPPYVIVDAPADGGKWFIYYNIDGGDVLTYICAKDEDTAIATGEELSKGDGFNRLEDLAIDLADETEIKYIEELISGDPDVTETRAIDTDIFDEDFGDPAEQYLEDLDDWYDEEDDLVPPELDDEGIVNICKSLYTDDRSAVSAVKEELWDEDGNRLEFIDWVYQLCDAFQLNCGIKTSVEIYNAIMHDKRFMAVLRADFDKLNQAE